MVWFFLQKEIKMGKMDSTKGIPLRSGGKMPAGVAKADMSGERMEGKRGGVAMGKMDKTGMDGEFNTGRTAGVCYEHKRTAYRGEDKSQK